MIDAHYYYPDGVAAAILAMWLDKPCVITARGSDLNLIPGYALPRRMIRWAASRAQASIGVSSALVEILQDLGVPAGRAFVMRNGIDLDRFRPVPQMEARATLGIEGEPVLLSVGNLVALKGHDIAIRVLAKLLETSPQAVLVIVGGGPEHRNLSLLAAQLGVEARVRFAGLQANDGLYRWYSAADVLILASSREGWPNVLLEAMACGTPVLATKVGGTPEIVADEGVGRLVDERSPLAFAAQAKHMLDYRTDRARVRKYAEGFGWEATTFAQINLFSKLVNPEVAQVNA